MEGELPVDEGLKQDVEYGNRLESCVWMRKNGQSNKCRKRFQCRRGPVSMIETTDASDRLGGCLRGQGSAGRLNRGIN